MPNKETKKFNKVIKARKKRVKRIARAKDRIKRPVFIKPAPEYKREPVKLSWWKRLISWLKRK